MKATDWEFRNRAVIFGLIVGVPFALYTLDPENVTAAFSNWLAPRLHANADLLARLLFAAAALLLIAAAFIRTWASSYLHAAVVYAAEVKSATLVADGPYRHVRNPLYFANILMAFGMGAVMSRAGFIAAIALMIAFCYRLVLREEDELLASQGPRYDAYRRAVPQLLPAPAPRIASSGAEPRWTAGFKAESWYWGFAAAVVAFAFTLNSGVFLAIVGASVALFWASSAALEKKRPQ